MYIAGREFRDHEWWNIWLMLKWFIISIEHNYNNNRSIDIIDLIAFAADIIILLSLLSLPSLESSNSVIIAKVSSKERKQT